MIDNIWIDDRYGLSLTAGPHATRDNSNGVLFYLEYILLKEAQGQDVSEDIAEFKKIVQAIRSYDPNNTSQQLEGMYDRGAGESLNPNKDDIELISHDNLTAIAAFDSRYGDGEQAAAIAKWGVTHGLLFDNAYPHKPRLKTIQWPTDWVFWALCSDKWYWKVPATILSPLFFLRSLIDNFGSATSTSGKLLNFVRFATHRDKSLPMKIMWKLCVLMWRHQYGDNWCNAIMAIYFQDPANPLHALSNNVKL